MSRDGSNPRAQGQHASKTPSAIVVRFLMKTPTVAQALSVVRFWPSMSLTPITPNSGCTSTLQIMTPCNFLMPYTAKSGCPILPANLPCKDNESPARGQPMGPAQHDKGLLPLLLPRYTMSSQLGLRPAELQGSAPHPPFGANQKLGGLLH